MKERAAEYLALHVWINPIQISLHAVRGRSSSSSLPRYMHGLFNNIILTTENLFGICLLLTLNKVLHYSMPQKPIFKRDVIYLN